MMEYTRSDYKHFFKIDTGSIYEDLKIQIKEYTVEFIGVVEDNIYTLLIEKEIIRLSYSDEEKTYFEKIERNLVNPIPGIIFMTTILMQIDKFFIFLILVF